MKFSEVTEATARSMQYHQKKEGNWRFLIEICTENKPK